MTGYITGMKKAICMITALTVVFCATCAYAESEQWNVLLSGNDGTADPELAIRLLKISTQYSQEMTKTALTEEGFTVRGQYRYDKQFDDPGHTCAFTYATRNVGIDGIERPAALVTIRGTSGYEWQSNFDIAPTRNPDTGYAENFSVAALDVFLTIKPSLDLLEEPFILVCGHSRGGACANLLGMLLDDTYGEDNVLVYTFATPATIRGEREEGKYNNIFNYIDPCDVVTKLPLSAWGFSRAGQDIILNGNSDQEAILEQSLAVMTEIAGNISEYYGLRYSLTTAGESEDGMTAFEMLSMLTPLLAGIGSDTGYEGMSWMSSISPESDLYDFAALLYGIAGERGQALLMHHMPNNYIGLIREIEESKVE